ncbi:MAG: RNA polymerase sigma factor [Deltaproteobacteria bacterium]|nr:RNA polymerase sigma factor [Deltaproteobacteria bacterium]
MNSFNAFYRENRHKIFAYLMRITRDYYLACDIMQESFTRYLEKYGNAEPRLALIFKIARNAFYDHARKDNRSSSLQEEPASDHQSQEHLVMVREEFRRVADAMQQLSPKERDVLALVVSSDLPYAEIASIVGISEANVKVSVHRARKQLLNKVRGTQ